MKIYKSDTYEGDFKRLRVGLKYKAGDFATAKINPLESGWVPVTELPIKLGRNVTDEDSLYFYRRIEAKKKQ